MFSAHEQADQPILDAVVWLIAHRQIEPGSLVDDALFVRKCAETGLAMVRAHAAGADAAERQIIGREMDDGVVDAAATELQTGHHLTRDGLILGENVKGEGPRHIVELVDGVAEIFVAANRQDRSKDLFLHDGVAPFHIAQNSRLNLQIFRRGPAAVGDLFRIDEAAESVEMLAVDDVAVVWIFQRRIAKLGADLGDERA